MIRGLRDIIPAAELVVAALANAPAEPAPIDPAIKGKFKGAVEKVIDGDGRVDRHAPPTGPASISVAPSGSAPDKALAKPTTMQQQHGVEVQS